MRFFSWRNNKTQNRIINQNNKSGMNTVKINGVSYQSTKNITVINGKVIIDGKDVTPEGKEITISVEGNIGALSVDQCSKLSVNGDVKSVETTSGDVEIKGGNVLGSISTTSGDVDCGDVAGDISTISGDVDCGKVGGNVESVSGDIKQRMF